MKKANVLIASGAIALLASCSTYSLQELRHTTPKGTPFQTALAKLYTDYAIQEEKNYDWFTSMYFADKGLRAAYGKDVEPEQPENWNVPDSVLPTMQKARKILVELLTEQTKNQYPQVAARAVYNFDCWVENQEENWQADEIGSCRDGLQDAFERLNAPAIELAPMVDPEAPAPVPAPSRAKPIEQPSDAPVALPAEQDRVEAPVAPKEEQVSRAVPAEAPAANNEMQVTVTTESKPAQLIAQAGPGQSQSEAAVAQANNIAAESPAENSWVAEPPADEMAAAEDEPAKSTVEQRVEASNEPAAAPAMSPSAAGVDTSSYMVFFDDRSTGLPSEGKKVVDEISKTLKGTVDYSVVIGSGEHVEFAKERAEAVKKRLVEGGVKADAITVSVAQVPDFMADSGEGDSTPIRHRVEIYLNQ